MKKNIFVALDFSDLDKALHVSNLVKDYAAGLKITNELFAVCGREGIKKLSELGLEIFLDLKLHDVPNTVKKTVSSISSLGIVNYLTIHTSGGIEMIKAAKEAAKELELLGVTILTSQNASKDQVNDLANLGIQSGLSGIIASAQEYISIRSLDKNLKIFCPGIRGLQDKKDDQKRIMSYSEFCGISRNDDKAFAVIGRPIYETGDAGQNIKKIIQSAKL